MHTETVSCASQTALLPPVHVCVLQMTPQGPTPSTPCTKGTRLCSMSPPCCHIPKKTGSRCVGTQTVRRHGCAHGFVVASWDGTCVSALTWELTFRPLTWGLTCQAKEVQWGEGETPVDGEIRGNVGLSRERSSGARGWTADKTGRHDGTGGRTSGLCGHRARACCVSFCTL